MLPYAQISKLKLPTLFILGCLLLLGCHSSSNEKKIGIIVPLENKSLVEIVSGFTETLRTQSPYPLKFKIANAQGDINLQRGIIQQMKDENYDMIVPIGTVATQMSVGLIKQQPIVSLAANYSQQDREKQKNCNIAIVHDEISSEQIIAFIHKAYPNLTHLTLIHSASDKIFPEVKTVINAGKKFGIEIKPIMVPTLNDLYSIATVLPENTQGIFILKDILIASGISTLEMVAEKKHIPVITSDQGSVQDGATFGLGVHEKEIGIEGGKLATEILNGKSACALPIIEMKNLTIFMNVLALAKTNLSFDVIKSVAKKSSYTIEMINKQE